MAVPFPKTIRYNMDIPVSFVPLRDKLQNMTKAGDSKMLRITALMDNNASGRKSLIHEHGLSFLVEKDEFRFLFDCGSGSNTWYNAHRLGLSLENLDGVIISHSHYDHAGGYRDLIEYNMGSQLLYTGAHFFEPKFAFDGVKYTDLSAGFDLDFLQENGIRREEVSNITEIAPGIYLIGSFPREHSFETVPGRFVRRTDSGFVADDFPDEICMAIDIGGRLVVLVGCSHPGILNMVQHVRRTLNLPIYALFGGTHLVEADERRIETTVEQLCAMGVELLGLSHCSGDQAERCICRSSAVRSCHLGVGDCIFLDI